MVVKEAINSTRGVQSQGRKTESDYVKEKIVTGQVYCLVTRNLFRQC